MTGFVTSRFSIAAGLAIPLLTNCSTGSSSKGTFTNAGTTAVGTGGAGGADVTGDSGISNDASATDSADAAAVDWDSLGTIYSGVPWLDTDGKLVNAHGVGFIRVGDVYYMVGEQRSGLNDTYSGAPINAEDTFTGVNMYTTTNFVDWTFVGTVVNPISGTILGPPYYGERPKILYNSSTNKYVIYIKMLNYTGDPLVYVGYYAVLTSSSIAGPYTYVGNLKQSGADVQGANDFQVFEDTDGKQYFVRDGGELDLLSDDGLGLAHPVKFNVQPGEGVSLFEADGTYFWQSSQGTYWHSNDNSYSSASGGLSQLFVAHGTFCPRGTMTWQSQSTAVLPVRGTSETTYIYVGDRWVNGDLPASTLVVQPLTINGNTETIPVYNAAWKLDVASGTWKVFTPDGTSINDGTIGTGQNQFNYSGDWASSACTGCEGGDLHSSSTAGATASVTFSGNQILLYSAYDNNSGIMGVTLCDANGSPLGPEVHVSLRYDAPAAGNYLVPGEKYEFSLKEAGYYLNDNGNNQVGVSVFSVKSLNPLKKQNPDARKDSSTSPPDASPDQPQARPRAATDE